jgi:glycosyltransferase involved in cell wall biosynthesis
LSLLIRKRLLFLCQTLPFPPDGGVNIRSFNILRLLSRRFDVTALCFYRRAERGNPEAVANAIRGLLPYARVEAFAIPQEHHRTRLLWDHGRSVLRGRAYTVYAYESAAYRKRVRDLVASGEIDLVHMDSLDLAAYLPSLGALPVVCTHHNVESQLLWRRALAEEVPWRRVYLRWQAAWLEALEREWCGRVGLNVAVSDLDRAALQRIAPAARIAVVPNGVDVDAYAPSAGGPGAGERGGLVFVGGANWFPNRDALEFFCTDILPHLRNGATGGRPALPIVWVGRSSPQDQERYAADFGVRLTGYVDDIRPYVREATCYVVPLRVGGGTRLKILDAWAMGKAVVSTTVGCEGLAAAPGENILIADTPEEFATAVRHVLTDPVLRERLGRGGRRTAESTYSWDVIGAQVNALYQSLTPAEASVR